MRRGKHRGKPERIRVADTVAVCIEGIYAVMFGRNEHHIVRLPADRHVGKIERLRVDVSVHGLREEFAKLRGVYIGRSQDGLIEILPSSRNVVAPGGNADLSFHRKNAGRQKQPNSEQRPKGPAQSRRCPKHFL